MDKLLKQHPYYDRSRIGANLYPGQTSGVNTFAVTAELVALASLPESEVRTLRDVLNERLKQFTRLHPALTTLTWEGMRAGSIALLHPGMLDAVPTSRRTPSRHPVPGRPRVPCRPCPRRAARPHRPMGQAPGRHRATGGVRHLAGAAGRRDPLNQFGAASTNQAPALTEPPTPGSATLAPGHPLTPPEAPASSATPLEAPSPEAMPASPPSHAVGTTAPPGNEHQPRGHPRGGLLVIGNGRLACHGASSSAGFWISSSTQCSSCLMARDSTWFWRTTYPRLVPGKSVSRVTGAVSLSLG